MRKILTCENLSRTYIQGAQEVIALAPATLAFYEGEFTAITGRSGSGKSTLLHLLGGLDKPSGGEVWVDGSPLYEIKDTQRTRLRCEKLGFIFQAYHLIPELTVLENIRLPLDFSGKTVNLEEIKQLLELLDMGDRIHFYPAELSGGQQQRVAIARALAAKPAVILADEPTGNLDVASSNAILSYLQLLNQKYRQAMIMVTHDPSIAKLANRNIVLEDGQIIEDTKRRE